MGVGTERKVLDTVTSPNGGPAGALGWSAYRCGQTWLLRVDRRVAPPGGKSGGRPGRVGPGPAAEAGD